MNIQEARSEWQADKAMLEEKGVYLPDVTMYMPDEWKGRSLKQIAMDAQPTISTDPSSGIPSLLTTVIDPEVIRIVFTPLQFAKILTERRAGDWLEETRIFPVVEETGEVSSYGDFNNNGRAGVNLNFPNFQSYLFQTFVRYGERELERAGLAKINYVSELGVSAADLLNRYQNLSYAFGISGLQNYGIINNPYLSSYLTPATKAAGGTTWFVSGSPNATANEVYNDIVAIVEKLINQTNGTLDMDAKMTLAMSPQSAVALKFANSFGVYVSTLLKDGFPNMKVMIAPQYGQQTTSNPQGYSTAGNAVQLIAEEIMGQRVAYAAFNEKLRAHKIIPEPSAWQQKMTSGTWGTILRMPLGVSGMLGV
ncbi:MAG: hypothetical protein ACLP3R_11150 [Candidatus Korobacteraceae bacterium]